MIGTILNRRYRIVEEIGSGGMAHVYKAVNMANRRTVAIKMLKEEYKDDTEFLRRFSREAGTVMRLNHENIVRAYDVGEYDGVPYIVMEYVEGRTLKELIDANGPLPVRTAIGITCQILDALSQAHEYGIIHRDVKPQNVIVTDRGKAKLTDFGIAREAKASTSTFSGKKVLGSVHYISPEQAKNAVATEESDLYSVGVTLYEMLTGTVPFTSDSAVTIALMHIQDKPTPPKELNPSIGEALNDIVMRALEKEPSDRYESARAMRTDLVRSISNPDGTFARDRSPDAPSAARRSVSVYLLIALGVFIPVAAIFIGIIVYATSCQARTDVPVITEEATAEPTVLDIEANADAPTDAPDATPLPTAHATNVQGLGLDEALSVLHGIRDAQIWVRFATNSDAATIPNTVIGQEDFTDESGMTHTVLTVYRTSLGSYHADVSFTYTPEADAHLRIAYETTNYLDLPYRVIVYEADRPYENADVTVAATVYGYDPATRPLTLTVNNKDIATQSVAFTK